MYCILKYNIDYHIRTESVLELPEGGEPFNAILYFNPNCILRLILDFICSKTHLLIDGEIYSMCTESGDMLPIKDYEPVISGLTIFQQRETYFIISLKRSDSKHTLEEIVPILNPRSSLYDTVSKKINQKYFPRRTSLLVNKRRASSSKHSIVRSTSSKSNTSVRSKTRRSSANI